jgi:hypothetical protein
MMGVPIKLGRYKCVHSTFAQMASRAASACHLPLKQAFCAETLNAVTMAATCDIGVNRENSSFLLCLSQ